MKLRQIIAIPRQNLGCCAHSVFGNGVFGHNHAKGAIRRAKGGRSVALVYPQHPKWRVKAGQAVAALRAAAGKRARAHTAIGAKAQIIPRGGAAPLRCNLQGGGTGAGRRRTKARHLPPCAQHPRNGQGGGRVDRRRARAIARCDLRRGTLRATNQRQTGQHRTGQHQKGQPCP